jgi:hypothetical protein
MKKIKRYGKDEKINLSRFELGVKNLFNSFKEEKEYQNKEIIIFTEGTDFGVSKIFGDCMNEEYKNIRLIGINSIQNIFSVEELNTEVLYVIFYLLSFLNLYYYNLLLEIKCKLNPE